MFYREPRPPAQRSLTGRGEESAVLTAMYFILRSVIPARRVLQPAGTPGLRYSSVAPDIRERTLIAVKPDGVQRRLVGEIVKRFEHRGFKLVGMKMLQASEGILSEHYHDLRRKPFYPSLIRYMGSGPVVAMVWEGCNVVRTSRFMVGETDASLAKPGTVRGDFSVHISRNVIHASDSVEVAEREISLWFHGSELIEWETTDHDDLYQV